MAELREKGNEITHKIDFEATSGGVKALVIEAMLAALKEAEKAMCMRCARGDRQIERNDTVGHFVHEVFDGHTTSFAWCTAAAITSLRSQLTEEKP